MRLCSKLLLLLPALAPVSAMAQQAGVAPAQSNGQIIVEGQKATKTEQMSGWHVAETTHVLVYSNGYKEDLVRVAHNLEKLHFLLSVLLNRVGEPDDVTKLKVVLIGDRADFDHLELHNLRWQEGPFAKFWPEERYYDPRVDGAVFAIPTTDQGVSLHTIKDLQPDERPDPKNIDDSEFKLEDAMMARNQEIQREGFVLTADSRLYSGYAQHYLMNYFPAAYPRWFLDGFGEVFSTVVSSADDKIAYGFAPDGFYRIMRQYGRYPVGKLFDGSYLDPGNGHRGWTPFHAWVLVHMLFFSDEWREPLHRYLTAVARGVPPAEAAKELGDPAKLQAAIGNYRGRKIPFERMTFPSERAAAPVVRQLSQREAKRIQGELLIDSRIELPPSPPAGADTKTTAEMTRARQEAVAARDRWLAELRHTATQYPRDIEAQLLLAEAECRVDHVDACLAAAERGLALAPGDVRAMTWAGVAQTRQAISGPAGEREAKLVAARALFVRANHADPEAPLPLLAYYRSYADAGETAPEAAVNGLIKVTEVSPAAPGPRVLLGQEFAQRGAPVAAAKALLPVADGAYDSPEKARAQALLASLSKH
jgi:hypothetical protein